MIENIENDNIEEKFLFTKLNKRIQINIKVEN